MSDYRMSWLKLYTYNWLRGTIRVQLTAAERSIWADFLALASESRVRGTICRAKNLPYTREELSQMLCVAKEDLDSTIAKCCTDPNEDGDGYRMRIDESGCLVICNFNKYQDIPAEKMRETPREKELREKSMLSKLMRKYPTEATLQTVAVVNQDTGEIVSKLVDPVRIPERHSSSEVIQESEE